MRILLSRSHVFGAAFLVTLFSLTFCERLDKIRYKIIVDIETVDGIKSGYSINEVSYENPYPIPSLGESRGRRLLKGEAVIIEVPGDKMVFALLKGVNGDIEYPMFVPEKILGYNGKSVSKKSVKIWPKSGNDVAYPRKDMPLLVTFDDISRPDTVKEFDPSSFSKFGNKIRSIRIELTNDKFVKK